MQCPDRQAPADMYVLSNRRIYPVPLQLSEAKGVEKGIHAPDPIQEWWLFYFFVVDVIKEFLAKRSTYRRTFQAQSFLVL